MDNQQRRLADLGWVGGIIDGEGNVSMVLTHDRRRTDERQIVPHIKVSNTDEELLDILAEILTREGIAFWRGHNSAKPRQENHKICSVIVINGLKRTLRFIEVFQPFTKRKWRQMEVIKRFGERRFKRPYHAVIDEFDLLLIAELRRMNHRGSLQERSETNTLDTVDPTVMIEPVPDAKAQEVNQ